MLSVKCPRCSQPMPRLSTFCRRCGLKLDSPDAATTAPPDRRPATVPDTSSSDLPVKLIFGGIALAAFVLVAVMAFFLVRSPSPRYVTPSVASNKVTTPTPPARPTLPPLPPLPPFSRHLPNDLPAKGSIPADRDLRGQMLTQNRYLEEDMSGAIFAGAYLLQATFEKANLQNADFRGAEFLQTTLAGADLYGAKFDGASFSQSQFTSIDTSAVAGQTRVVNGIVEPVPAPPLPARNAGKASYRKTRFNGVNFDGMDLSGGDFEGASFAGGSLRDADLRGANLRDARFSVNDFGGARLDGADLRGADLSSVRNLKREQVRYAQTDSTTRLPPTIRVGG